MEGLNQYFSTTPSFGVLPASKAQYTFILSNHPPSSAACRCQKYVTDILGDGFDLINVLRTHLVTKTSFSEATFFCDLLHPNFKRVFETKGQYIVFTFEMYQQL